MASGERTGEFKEVLTEEDMDPHEAVFSEVEDDESDDDSEEESEEEDGDDDDDDNGSEDEESGDDVEEEEEEGEQNGENQLEADDSSSDENSEICPICLNRLRQQDIGTPESCDHCFCLECIQEWARNVNTCPVDRQVFHLILARHAGEEKIFQQFPVEDKQSQEEVPVEEEEEDPTYCEVCHQANREDRLLLCDGCDLGYHCDCLTPSLADVPVDEWFCPTCQAIRGDPEETLTQEHRRQIARTRVSERVRRTIQDARVERMQRRRRVILDSSDDEEEKEASYSTTDPGPSSSTSSRATTAQRRTSATRGIKRKRTSRKRASLKRKKRKTTTLSSSTGKKKRRKKRKTTKKGKGKGKKNARTKKYQAVTPAMPAPSSVKGRIADRLGLSKPPMGWSIPLQKTPSGATGSGGVGGGRLENSLPSSLSILGNKDELYHFADQEGEEREIVSRPAILAKSLLSSSAKMSHVPLPLFPTKRKIVVTEPPAVPASSQNAPAAFDLLGSILQNQELLTKSSQHVTINRDGSLSAANSSTNLSSSKKSSQAKNSSGESVNKSSSSSNIIGGDRNITENITNLSSSSQSGTNISNGTSHSKHRSSSTTTVDSSNVVRKDTHHLSQWDNEDIVFANSTDNSILDNNSFHVDTAPTTWAALDDDDHLSDVDPKSDEELLQCMDEIENTQHGEEGDKDEEASTSSRSTRKERKGEERTRRHDKVKKRFKQLVEDAVRSALRPAWSNRKISKDVYKDIFKKCVEKVCGSKETVVQQDKIRSLVDAYVAKARKAATKSNLQ